MDGLTHEMLDVTATLRDNIANFDDFFHPIRGYFYWDKHCFDIPVCWSLRSIFDALDGLDQIVEKFSFLTNDIAQLDALMPEMLATVPVDDRDHDDDEDDDADDAQLDEFDV